MCLRVRLKYFAREAASAGWRKDVDTFPNPALRSEALNRSEPTLIKRKFSRSAVRLQCSVFADRSPNNTRQETHKGIIRLDDVWCQRVSIGDPFRHVFALPKSSPCMGLRLRDFRRFIAGVRLRPDTAIDFNQCRGCGSLTNIDRLRRWTRGESCQKQSLAGTRSRFSDWERYWAWPDRA